MLAGEGVLALEEEGARELEAHAHEVGALDQHDAERGDRLVEEFVPVVLGDARLLGGLQRGEAAKEDEVRVYHAGLREAGGGARGPRRIDPH